MTYNPMSKEFQDECKILGLNGRQLIAKYEKEGKYIKKEKYKYEKSNLGSRSIYTDGELLDYLKRFYKEHGRIPVVKDFVNNPEYPGFSVYYERFGSWSKALKLVGLDLDSMVKDGVLITSHQKARLAEIRVIDHFKTRPIDLAGENGNNSCDGICPNGMSYDVKSSKLHKLGHYLFNTRNRFKEKIKIYYFLGFNEDYTKIRHAWRVPGMMAESNKFYVGVGPSYKFNIENMKEYDITDKFREILVSEKSK